MKNGVSSAIKWRRSIEKVAVLVIHYVIVCSRSIAFPVNNFTAVNIFGFYFDLKALAFGDDICT